MFRLDTPHNSKAMSWHGQGNKNVSASIIIIQLQAKCFSAALVSVHFDGTRRWVACLKVILTFGMIIV